MARTELERISAPSVVPDLVAFGARDLRFDLPKAYVVQISFKTLAKFAPTIFSATRVG
jgi:hypothetical protein